MEKSGGRLGADGAPNEGQVYGLAASALRRMEAAVGEPLYCLSLCGGDRVRVTASLQEALPLSQQQRDPTLAAMPPVDFQKLREAVLRETLFRRY